MVDTTKEQDDIINARPGHIRVIACAGSGKTTVITKRISRLVNKGLVSPSKISVITFTKKAAQHMENKLLQELEDPHQLNNIFIGTIHSLCFNLLKDFYPDIGEYYRVMDEDKQFLLFYLKYEEWGIDKFKSEMHKYKKIKKIVTSIEILQKEMIEETGRIDPYLLKIKDQYEDYLSKNNYFDYGQLIKETVERLVNDKEFYEWVRERIDYLFVDEYQDVDNLQEKLIELISKNNTFVVGDDDQSIYQFRGTDVQNIQNFENKYKKVSSFSLSKNWRCPEKILSLANNIIKKNQNRIEKKMVSTTSGGLIKTRFFKTVDEETDFIINEINSLIECKQINSLFNVAILLRSVKSSGSKYLENLKKSGFQPLVIGDSNLFQREEISEVRSCLEFLVRDDLNEESKKHLMAIFPIEFVNEISEYENIYQVSINPLKKKYASLLINKFKNLINLKEIYLTQNYENITELLYLTIDALNLVNSSSNVMLKNIASLTKISNDFDEIHRSKNLKKFLGYLSLYAQRNFDEKIYDEEEIDSIRVMTIHQAKGLEFDAVFLPMMVNRRFPIIKKEKRWFIPNDLFPSDRYMSSIEDERRLLYVAITRARSFLYVTGAAKHPSLQRSKEPSTFFNDINKFAEEDGPLDSRSSLPSLENEQNVFSFSEIEYYITCPYRYMLIYKIGFKTMPNPYFEFGRSIHYVLSIIHSEYKKGKKLTEDMVEKIYNKNFHITANLPIFQIVRRKRHGLEAILKYFNKYKEILENIYAVEKDIVLKFKGAIIKGRIDLILRLNDSNYDIIDFKTGKYRDYLGQRTQLQFYAMAIKNLLDIKNINSILHFIEEDKRLDVPTSPKNLEKAKDRIFKAICGIKNRDFKATPGAQCSFCEFRIICPYKTEVKYEGYRRLSG